jgi:hypothetical protein
MKFPKFPEFPKFPDFPTFGAVAYKYEYDYIRINGDVIMKTLIGIQDEYVETVNAAISRWSHRRDGGHSSRTRRAARRKAEKALGRLQFTEAQIAAAIKDARDMAELERNANAE